MARYREFGMPTLFLLSLALIWEIAVRTGQIATYLLPAPSAIGSAMLLYRSLLVQNTLATLQSVGFGLLLALSTGLILGIALFYWPLLKSTLYPLLIASRNIPYYAIAPLLIVWFGLGFLPKVIVATLIAFFPIVVNTHDGLKAVDPDLVKLMQTLGASRFQILRKVRFPAALPLILSGVKLGAVFAVVGALFGELIGGQRWTPEGLIGGLGYLMREAANRGALDLAFAGMVWLSALSLALFGVVALLERYLLRWQISERA
ncbi:ABC transporter permease [Candidatus Acetothermia bacterium]|nr:ABC transporter permease [Candidatus Acetothermia bacterium]MBI3460918.1 ABC transporter permease [Candidatus Acetothermia bacterium]